MSAARATSLLLTALGVAATVSAQDEPLFPAPLIHVAPPDTVATADFNGDAVPDVVCTNSAGTKLSVALGVGGGLFASPAAVTVGSGYSYVIAADVDGLNGPDLVAVNAAAANVAVLLGDGLGGFSAPATYGVAAGPNAVAAGDLNGDTLADLVTSNGAANSVSVLINLGGGVFGPPSSMSVGASANTPRGLVLLHLNADNVLDLVTCNGGSNNVSIFLGNGLGGFNPPTFAILAPGTASTAIASADFNTDGKPDVVIANGGNSSVTVLLGTGTGGFGAHPSSAVGASPGAVAALDLNADGKADVVTANPVANTMTVMLGVGNGSFAAPKTLSQGKKPQSVQLADMNDDGEPDLLAAFNGNNAVSLMLGLGTGDFLVAESVGSGAGPAAVALADLNGDDLKDLVTVNATDGTLWVMLAAGEGDFSAPTVQATDGNPRAVVVADVNADTFPDLVTVNATQGQGPGTVSVLLGDGTGAFAAQLSSDGGSGPQSLAIGDVNHDTFPDLVIGNPVLFGPSGSVSVRLGDGLGGFGAITSFTVGQLPSLPQALTLADVTGDDNLDIVTANAAGLSTSSVSILPGDGTGLFGAALELPLPSGLVQNVAVADINGDTVPDIVTLNASLLTSATVAVFPGTGAGAFDPPQTYSAGVVFFAGLVVEDLDADDLPDVVTANRALPYDVSVLRGTAGGALAAPIYFAAGAEPVALAAGDVDDDGAPDLAVAKNNAAVVVLMNQTPPPPPPPPDPWTDLGSALAGVSGLPALAGVGTLEAGSPTSLTLSNANPSAATLLFVSLASTPVPLKGGTLVAFPALVTVSLATDPSGVIALPFLWPTGFPTGTTLYFQYGIQDPAAVLGVALSNGLKGLTP